MARRAHEHAWHYETGGEKLGPFAEGDFIGLISTGIVKSSTPVWRQGMADWLAAGTTELNKHFTDTGAPKPETVQAVAAANQKAEEARTRQIKPQGETRSVSGFQKWLQISLMMYAIGAIVGMTISAWTLYFYHQVKTGVFEGNENALNQTANLIDTSALVIVSLTVITFLSSAIAYSRFFHRCVVNLHAMHSRHVSSSPHESWAWYFVPILSLWKPLGVFQEVQEGSHYAAGDKHPGAHWVAIWWGSWIIGIILTNIADGFTQLGNGIDKFSIGVTISLLAGLCLATAALSLRFLVGQIGPAHEQARLSGNISVFD